jgi:uncharacterized membrane protein YfcA
MNLSILLLLIVIGIITGAVSGLIGIGGGLILIPALIYFMGFNQHQAVGTSLAVLLPPIGFFAAYNYYKAGFVNLKFAMVLALAFMIGSFFTSKWAISIPEQSIRKFFSIVLFIVAIKMFFSR